MPDARGPTHEDQQRFGVGEVKLRFCISDKKPKYPGFVVNVAGKVVGKSSQLELDDDPEVPAWLLARMGDSNRERDRHSRVAE